MNDNLVTLNGEALGQASGVTDRHLKGTPLIMTRTVRATRDEAQPRRRNSRVVTTLTGKYLREFGEMLCGL